MGAAGFAVIAARGPARFPNSVRTGHSFCVDNYGLCALSHDSGNTFADPSIGQSVHFHSVFAFVDRCWRVLYCGPFGFALFLAVGELRFAHSCAARHSIVIRSVD